MEDSIPPFEKRVEELRYGAARKSSGGCEKTLEHTGILELDDDTFYNEQDYDTRENSPPKKATLPPRRTSSLQGSPSPIHIHGHAHELAPATPSPRPTRTSSLRVSPPLVPPNAKLSSPLQSKAKSPTAGAKNVSFNENIVVLERVEEQEEAPGTVEKSYSPRSILQGGAGFGLLSAYMFLLLLNGFAFPALRFLFSAKLYTEALLFWLWCFALRKPMIAQFVCIPAVIGVMMAVLAGAIIVVYLMVCVGTVLALLWWVWMICMLLVPESQKLIAGGD